MLSPNSIMDCFLHILHKRAGRNFNLLPFRGLALPKKTSPIQINEPMTKSTQFKKVFTFPLGPPHSWHTSFPMKPFASSAHSNFTNVNTTSSKICTKGGSSKIHTKPSAPPSRKPTKTLSNFKGFWTI